MKKAALILGVIGGSWACALPVIWLLTWDVEVDPSSIVSFAVAIALALVGIIGGALSLKRPVVASILMLISAAGGATLVALTALMGVGGWEMLAIFFGYLVGTPLLTVGGMLAIISRKSSKIVEG